MISPSDPVDRLPGIGAAFAAALRDESVRTVADLLLWVPRRYEARGAARSPAALTGEVGPLLVRGRLGAIRCRRTSGRRHRVDGVLCDGDARLPVVWFNQPWLERSLPRDVPVLLWGSLRRWRGRLEMVCPEVSLEEGEAAGVVAVYPRLGPLGPRRVRRLQQHAAAALERLADPLPESLRRELGLPGLAEALTALHRPPAELDPAALAALAEGRSPGHRRLAFDELLALACAVLEGRERRRSVAAWSAPGAPAAVQRALGELPFVATAAQERVAREVAADLAGRHPMARLLQGDVGAGKTAVAAVACRLAIEAGGQAAVMAPTELLAAQHRQALEQLLRPAGIDPVLLTGSLPTAEQRRLRSEIRSGEARLVVGTHALIQDAVAFSRLTLAVIDEQHRFGVAQRQALVEKGRMPHLLVMSATPIPRSLALTAYGDLDLSVLDELPPGRRPVRTVLRPVSARTRVLEFVRREVAEGGRAFVVVPLIEASEAVQARDLEGHLRLLRRSLQGIGLAVLHGRLPAPEREAAVQAFRRGTAQVLVATTMVEVGIDVPEATVMVIESPDRFGLAQLHQLRGRVGRGPRASWCVLLAQPEMTPEANARLEVLARSDDGFFIAEEDLRLRGPGELTGVRQWGAPRSGRGAPWRHPELVEAARETAVRLARDGVLSEVRSALEQLYSWTQVPVHAG